MSSSATSVAGMSVLLGPGPRLAPAPGAAIGARRGRARRRRRRVSVRDMAGIAPRPAPAVIRSGSGLRGAGFPQTERYRTTIEVADDTGDQVEARGAARLTTGARSSSAGPGRGTGG